MLSNHMTLSLIVSAYGNGIPDGGVPEDLNWKIADPAFHSFALSQIGCGGFDDIVLIRTLTAILIMHPAAASTERALREESERMGDSWSLGLQKLCGIGTEPDRREAIGLLAGAGSPLSAALSPEAFGIADPVYAAHMVRASRMAVSGCSPVNVDSMLSRAVDPSIPTESRRLYAAALCHALSTGRDMAAASRCLDRIADTEGPESASLKAALYSICRPYTYRYKAMIADSGESFRNDWERICYNIERMSRKGLGCVDSVGFVASMNPDRLSITDPPFVADASSERMLRLASAMPIASAASVMGLDYPITTDFVLSDAEIPEEYIEEPPFEEGYIPLAARFGYPSAQADLARTLRDSGNGDWGFWMWCAACGGAHVDPMDDADVPYSVGPETVLAESRIPGTSLGEALRGRQTEDVLVRGIRAFTLPWKMAEAGDVIALDDSGRRIMVRSIHKNRLVDACMRWFADEGCRDAAEMMGMLLSMFGSLDEESDTYTYLIEEV